MHIEIARERSCGARWIEALRVSWPRARTEGWMGARKGASMSTVRRLQQFKFRFFLRFLCGRNELVSACNVQPAAERLVAAEPVDEADHTGRRARVQAKAGDVPRPMHGA